MITTILIFIAVLGLLVFVHEFGHFIVAKKSGMVVEEFGFGFPPRLVGIQKLDGKWRMVWFGKSIRPDVTINQNLNEVNPTIYSINWIPLGGFVRILGENNEHTEVSGSFVSKGFWPRFLTLVAGVCMNILLAFVLLSAGFMIGLPAAVNSVSDVPKGANFSDPQTAILDVVKDLPADKAGLKPSDIILSLDGKQFTEISALQSYIKERAGNPVEFKVRRGSQELNLPVTPELNPAPGQGATGIEVSLIGKLRYVWYTAIWEGAQATYGGIVAIFAGLYQLLAGHLGFASLGGPVKIAKLTGQVADMGFIYLLQFTAFLSLNLAALNILPFPALDGGRILFLFIEKIRGKKNNQKIEQYANAAGFVFLLLLMAVVTINDLIRK
jgi:regulator of sigma E protease